MTDSPDSPVAGPLHIKVEAFVRPIAEAKGVEVLSVDLGGSRDRRTVKIVADHEDGLDIDLITDVSRAVASALDAEDLIEGSYTLEVTSPGVDRPLRELRDFRRNVGRDVRFTRNGNRPEGSPGEVTGRIKDVTDDAVTIMIKGRTITLSLGEIDHGKIVLPW